MEVWSDHWKIDWNETTILGFSFRLCLSLPELIWDTLHLVSHLNIWQVNNKLNRWFIEDKTYTSDWLDRVKISSWQLKHEYMCLFIKINCMMAKDEDKLRLSDTNMLFVHKSTDSSDQIAHEGRWTSNELQIENRQYRRHMIAYLYKQGSCMPHYGNHGKLCYGGPAASLHGCRSKSNQALWSSSPVVQHDLRSYRIL